MIENPITWVVAGIAIAGWTWREYKKTRVVDTAVDQAVKIKDSSIASLERDIARLRSDLELALKTRREQDEETHKIRANFKRRFIAIERDRDILRGIVKDLIGDIRKVKRADMPLGELNTGFVEDIEFTNVADD